MILGEAADDFRAPLNVYLVRSDAAAQIADQSDSRLINLGSLGTPGKFDVPRSFAFTVPDIPTGEYAVAVWFRGTQTDTWANALEGTEPTLEVKAREDGSDAGMAVWFAVGGGAAMTLLAAVLLGWRLRRTRSAASSE